MVETVRRSHKSSSLSYNAAAKNAFEVIARIEREAQEKKLSQLEALRSARAAIEERLQELQHQLNQIDQAVVTITGASIGHGRRIRRKLDDVRERLLRWMEARKGQKLSAGEIVREFSELKGTAVSVFIKRLVQDGRIKTDRTEGTRRIKYFVS